MPFDPNKPFKKAEDKPSYSGLEEFVRSFARGIVPAPREAEVAAASTTTSPEALTALARPEFASPSDVAELAEVVRSPEGQQAIIERKAKEEAFKADSPVLAYGAEYGPSVAPLVSGLAKGAAKGTKKAADYLMQRAVGLKKYDPGMGTKLIEQGIRGTKGQMASKIDDAMKIAESEAGKALDTLGPNAIGPENVSASLYRDAQKLIAPDGSIAPSDMDKYNALMHRAGQILEEEAKSPQATRFLRSRLQAGSRAKSGEAKAALDAQLAQAEAKARTMALERNIAEESPEAFAQWRSAMEKERALLEAGKALDKPESVAAALKPVGTIIGGTVGGVPGAVTGWALEQPITQSYLATGLHKLASPVEAAASALPAAASAPGLATTASKGLEEFLKPKEEKPQPKKGFDPNKPFKPSK